MSCLLACLAIVAGLSTDHVDDPDDIFNEDNAIIALHHEYKPRHGVFAGTMVNSYDIRSYMAGGDYNLNYKGFGVGVLYGAIYGYPKEAWQNKKIKVVKASEPDLLPMAAPYVEVGPVRIIRFGSAIAATVKIELGGMF